MRVAIGDLNKRVSFQKRTGATDAGGGMADDWTTAFSLWAKVDTPSTGDYFNAMQMEQRVTHIVTVRWTPGISADMRIAMDGRYLTIKGVRDPDQRKRYLILNAEEVG